MTKLCIVTRAAATARLDALRAKFKTYEQAQTAYRPVIEITDDFSDLPLFATTAVNE